MQLLKDITLDFVLTNSHWQLVKLLSFTIEMGQDIEWEKILKIYDNITHDGRITNEPLKEE